MPVGYAAAEKILRHMAGREVPALWKGGLNITYKTGPGFMNTDW